jgi:hypothetical protein
MRLTEVFWIAFVTAVVGMIIKLASMAYKSKCTHCEFCCIKVDRDTVVEEKEREFAIEHNLESKEQL